MEKNTGKVISLHQDLGPDEKVEMLFRKYYGPLCKSLYRMLRDETLAEDLVQEVFLKVWEMRASLKMDEAIQAYLYRSCYNTALNFLKQQKKQQNTDIDSLEMAVAGSDSAERNLDLSESGSGDRKAIAALPPKTRMVFTLSRFEELSYKEIALRLDISVKSVEKHMGIALQRLRTNLHEYLVGLLLFLLSDKF